MLVPDMYILNGFQPTPHWKIKAVYAWHRTILWGWWETQLHLSVSVPSPLYSTCIFPLYWLTLHKSCYARIGRKGYTVTSSMCNMPHSKNGKGKTTDTKQWSLLKDCLQMTWCCITWYREIGRPQFKKGTKYYSFILFNYTLSLSPGLAG